MSNLVIAQDYMLDLSLQTWDLKCKIKLWIQEINCKLLTLGFERVNRHETKI